MLARLVLLSLKSPKYYFMLFNVKISHAYLLSFHNLLIIFTQVNFYLVYFFISCMGNLNQESGF